MFDVLFDDDEVIRVSALSSTAAMLKAQIRRHDSGATLKVVGVREVE